MPNKIVAVTDSVFPNLDAARDVVAKVGGELRLAKAPTPEGILEVARDADAILCTYAKGTTDIAKATSKGIVVTKVPDYCIDEVSDHAMALLLAIVRKIPFSNSEVQEGRWAMPTVVPIHRLRGTVLGLVGFGRIPQLVAPKAKAFGMRVMASDPFVPLNVLDQAGVERVEFANLVEMSDYISIHTPLLPET